MQEDTQNAESIESTAEVVKEEKAVVEEKPTPKRRKYKKRKKRTVRKVAPKVDSQPVSTSEPVLVTPQKPLPVLEPLSLQEQMVKDLKAAYPSLKYMFKVDNKYTYEHNKTTVLVEGEHDITRLVACIGKAEKYYEVLFSDRIDKNETVDVQLSVNGELLLFERNVKTIAPGRYLHCADNARHPTYIQDDTHNRKITGWVKTYPYQIMKEPYDKVKNPDGVTEADFFELKRQGDEIQRLARERRDKTG